jgi:polyhydroxyalkanoate synthesis regulator phasin
MTTTNDDDDIDMGQSRWEMLRLDLVETLAGAETASIVSATLRALIDTLVAQGMTWDEAREEVRRTLGAFQPSR